MTTATGIEVEYTGFTDAMGQRARRLSFLATEPSEEMYRPTLLDACLFASGCKGGAIWQHLPNLRWVGKHSRRDGTIWHLYYGPKEGRWNGPQIGLWHGPKESRPEIGPNLHESITMDYIPRRWRD